jgi:hypothetical protein
MLHLFIIIIGWMDCSALHYASMNGQHKTVRTLVELGVDKEAKDDKVSNLMMTVMIMMMMIMA